jgi:hypothetical protein
MLDDLPPSFLKKIRAEFDGEAIKWAGRPDRWKAFWSALPIWIFAVPWTVFALAWTNFALTGFFSAIDQAPDGSMKLMSIVFPLFGLPFVLIGLGMMGAPFWAWWKARRTVFVLSDQRVATALAGRTFNVTSVDLAWIASVHRQEKRTGSGTLNLGMGFYRNFDGDKVEKTVVMTGVPDVAELERLIVGTIRSRRALRDDGSNGANA